MMPRLGRASDRQFKIHVPRAKIRRAGAPGFAVVALLLMINGAYAGDPAGGLQLGRRWCASCHLVESGGIASDVAPGFPAIAHDPRTTPESLHAWLAKPHPPMPDLKLSRSDEDDILAYILSLKSN